MSIRPDVIRSAFGAETVALSQVEADLLQTADDFLDTEPQTPGVQKARYIIQGVIQDAEGDDPGPSDQGPMGPGGY